MDGDNEGTAEIMMEAERRHKVRSKLSGAMKAARQYGTGIMIMMTKEAPMDTPLVIERIRPGDLTALRKFDRYDCSINERDYDLASPNYGNAVVYNVHPTRGSEQLRVHESRVLRFDGIKPPSDSGFTVYEQDWGVSELIPVIKSIMQDESLVSAISHLSQEASIPILAVSNLRETMSGQVDGEISAEEIGAQINAMKSNYRLTMTDKEEEELSRVAVQFGGLDRLIDRFESRVAAAARIPRTRWLGSPPVGMNSTGESDMRNYIMTMEAERQENLPDKLMILDKVIAYDAGLSEVPEYEWQSLLEMSDLEIATAAKMKADALDVANKANWIDEDEARTQIDGDETFGNLPGDAPEIPDEDPPVIPPPGGMPKPVVK